MSAHFACPIFTVADTVMDNECRTVGRQDRFDCRHTVPNDNKPLVTSDHPAHETTGSITPIGNSLVVIWQIGSITDRKVAEVSSPNLPVSDKSGELVVAVGDHPSDSLGAWITRHWCAAVEHTSA